MAHCVISWPDETLNSFTVWDTSVEEDGMHVMVEIVYTTDQSLEKIEKIKVAGRDVIESIKPITDEFDRNLRHFLKPR